MPQVNGDEQKQGCPPNLISYPWTRSSQTSITSDPPPAGFDPLLASPDDQLKFGFRKLAGPDPFNQPNTLSGKRCSLKPLTFEPFVFQSLTAFQDAEVRILPANGAAETSLNWSGAYITPRDDTLFSSIWGTFQVPTPKPFLACPGTNIALPRGSVSTDSAVTICRRSRSLVPHRISNCHGRADASLFAWWHGGRGISAAFPITLVAPEIHAGDLIMCYMQVAADRAGVSFVMTNLTTSRTVQFFQGVPPARFGPARSRLPERRRNG